MQDLSWTEAFRIKFQFYKNYVSYKKYICSLSDVDTRSSGFFVFNDVIFFFLLKKTLKMTKEWFDDKKFIIFFFYLSLSFFMQYISKI